MATKGAKEGRDLDRRLKSIEGRLGRLQATLDRPRAGTRAKIRDKQFLELAHRINSEGRTLLGGDRLWTLWQTIGNVLPLGLPGAEIGSYKGGSAAFLAAAWRERGGGDLSLDVVDTFTGHPQEALGERDAPTHVPGLFGDTAVEEVREYLSAYPGVRVHQGAFADVKGELNQPGYGFVHVDVDLYEPMLDALRFFDERLPAGGVFVLDDFDARKCPGVRAAAEEFLAERPGYLSWTPLTEQLILTKR